MTIAETKWTPGPWEPVEDDYNDCWYVRRAPETGEIGEQHICDEIYRRADAALISAAPDLYEALKWFIDDIDSTHTRMLDFDANVERARSALAKARGEQP